MPVNKRRLNFVTYKSIDRGGNGDCLFRAVLDHFLPKATNENLRILSIALRKLVAEEMRRIALDTEERRRILIAQGYSPGQINDPCLDNTQELLNRAEEVEKPGAFAEDTEIVILAHMFNVDIITHTQGYANRRPISAKNINQKICFYADWDPIDTIRIEALGRQHYKALRDVNYQPPTLQQEENKRDKLVQIIDKLWEVVRLKKSNITSVKNTCKMINEVINDSLDSTSSSSKRNATTKSKNAANDAEQKDKKLAYKLQKEEIMQQIAEDEKLARALEAQQRKRQYRRR